MQTIFNLLIRICQWMVDHNFAELEEEEDYEI